MKKIKNVIFDAGGVILSFSKARPLGYIGIGNLLWYTFAQRKNPFKLLDRLLEINYQLETLQNGENQNPIKFKNIRLTGFIEKSLRNEISSYELLDDTLEKSHIACEKGLITKRERILLSRFANIILNPETGIEYIDVSKKCLEIIKKCKANKDIKLYVLSNWAADYFKLVEKRYSYIFDLFDGQIISGKVKMIKPEKGIYKKLLDEYNLDPNECIFIDDQEENLPPAETLGMKTVLWDNPKKVEHELKRHGII